MVTFLILVLWFISMWVLLFIVFPFILFPNYLIKPKIVYNMKTRQVANSLKCKKSLNTVKNIFNFVAKNHYGLDKSLKSKILNLPHLFQNNISELIEKKSLLFCHTQNLIFLTLFLNTGQFSENCIKIKWTISKNLCIHQYLLVKLKTSVVVIDPFYFKYSTKKV